MLSFVYPHLDVINTAPFWAIPVQRTGAASDLMQPASVNVRAGVSVLYSPLAENYLGQEVTLTWAAGESGMKQAQFRQDRTSSDSEYLAFSLNNPSEQVSGVYQATLHIHAMGVTPYFHPEPRTEEYVHLLTTDGATIVKPLSVVLAGVGSGDPYIGSIVGDGSTLSFTVEHDIGSLAPAVFLYDPQNNWLSANYQVLDANSIKVTPAVILAAGYKITVSVRK